MNNNQLDAPLYQVKGLVPVRNGIWVDSQFRWSPSVPHAIVCFSDPIYMIWDVNLATDVSFNAWSILLIFNYWKTNGENILFSRSTYQQLDHRDDLLQ